MTRTRLLLALLLLAAVHPAAAQRAASGRNSLRQGAWSLSFGLPAGAGGPELGAGLGVWRMVSARTNLGVDVDAQYARSAAEDGDGDERERELARARLGLGARRYLDPGRVVAPYLAGRVGAGVFREAIDNDDGAGTFVGRGWTMDASGGAGVEWFPARSVSVSGSTGVGVAFRRSRAPAGLEAGDVEGTELSVGTFTTELALRIYF